jgi:hypothetical protein
MIDPGLISRELIEYFRELSPRARRLRFEAIDGEDEQTMSFCEKLYRIRYTDPKDPDHKVDNWLWKIVYLPGLYSKKNFLRKAVSLEAEAAVRDLQLEDAGAYSDTEKTLLYLEFRNAAKRYLSTTKSDRYGSKLLGLKKAGPEDKAKKAAEDIWRASRGLAVASGETERLEIWCAALRDELIQFDKSCESHYDELDRRNQK